MKVFASGGVVLHLSEEIRALGATIVELRRGWAEEREFMRTKIVQLEADLEAVEVMWIRSVERAVEDAKARGTT